MDASPVAFRSILLLVPNEVLLFEATGLADIFEQSNRCLPADSPHPRYRVSVAATLKHRVIHGRAGMNLMADVCLADLDPNQGWDTLIVTGRGKDPEEQAVIADWLRQAAPHSRRTVSVCSGAFLLAQAGLLNGRKATTHWRVLTELAATYPQVIVEKDPIFVRSDPIWTSAGASSGFDLGLALVEDDLGPVLARQVAQYLVLYLRRPGGQSQFSSFLEAQASEAGPIRDLQGWALEHLNEDLGVERMADRVGMSPRNFARVFAQQTGTTPARFVEQLRVEAARQRLEQGRETLDRVASACGFGTALTLRRAFERTLGTNPSEYRERFGMN